MISDNISTPTIEMVREAIQWRVILQEFADRRLTISLIYGCLNYKSEKIIFNCPEYKPSEFDIDIGEDAIEKIGEYNFPEYLGTTAVFFVLHQPYSQKTRFVFRLGNREDERLLGLVFSTAKHSPVQDT